MARERQNDDQDDQNDMGFMDNGREDSIISACEAAEMASCREDAPEARSVTSRTRIRAQLQADIDAFLAQGGSIGCVQPNTTMDPPRRPSSEYGSRPI